jgi:hypothetical protein
MFDKFFMTTGAMLHISIATTVPFVTRVIGWS